MRTDAAFSARARSSARFTTWLTLTPGAGSNSYEVMIGPGLTCTMRPSTSKSWSLRRRISALSCSSSRVRLSSLGRRRLEQPDGRQLERLRRRPCRSRTSPARPAPAPSAGRAARDGSTTTGSAGSTSGVRRGADAGRRRRRASRTAGPRRCAARWRRSRARRAVASRATAAYEAWVTQQHADRHRGQQQQPRADVAERARSRWSAPSRPSRRSPRIPPRVTRSATNVSAACCSRPAAASSSTARPASGTQPRATTRPHEGATAPQAPSSSGSRKPA